MTGLPLSSVVWSGGSLTQGENEEPSKPPKKNQPSGKKEEREYVGALTYTDGVGTRSPVSPGSCCRSRCHPISSPRSSRPPPRPGGRPRWALPAPSSQSPETYGPSRPNRLQIRNVSALQKGGSGRACDTFFGNSISRSLTVAVPGEANPQVMILGVVEVSDELHLGSAVDRRQLPVDRLAVVPRVGPGETLLAVVHKVAVVAVGLPERDALARAGSRGGWRLL